MMVAMPNKAVDKVVARVIMLVSMLVARFTLYRWWLGCARVINTGIGELLGYIWWLLCQKKWMLCWLQG